MKTPLMLSGMIMTLIFASDFVRADDEELVANWSAPYKEELSLKAQDLELTGTFQVNEKHWLVINGFDNLDKPFSVRLRTKSRTDNSFATECIFVRGDQRKSASGLLEKNKPGKLTIESKNPLEIDVQMLLKITD